MSLIRSTFTAKGHLLDDLAAYVSSFQESVNQTLAEVTEENSPDILNELQYQPDKRSYPGDYPIEWTSEAQRKYYWAVIGQAPYQRTGSAAAGWVVVNDGNGRTVIANNDPSALWVYGSLAKSNPGEHQQLFNLITGYIPAYETVQVWTRDIADEIVKRIHDQFQELGSVSVSSRAYTRR